MLCWQPPGVKKIFPACGVKKNVSVRLRIPTDIKRFLLKIGLLSRAVTFYSSEPVPIVSVPREMKFIILTGSSHKQMVALRVVTYIGEALKADSALHFEKKNNP